MAYFLLNLEDGFGFFSFSGVKQIFWKLNVLQLGEAVQGPSVPCPGMWRVAADWGLPWGVEAVLPSDWSMPVLYWFLLLFYSLLTVLDQLLDISLIIPGRRDTGISCNLQRMQVQSVRLGDQGSSANPSASRQKRTQVVDFKCMRIGSFASSL